MGGGTEAKPIPAVAKVYAILCFLFALLGVFGLTVANSAGMIGRVIFYIAISLAAGIAILRRDKAAPTAVWIFTVVSRWSTLTGGLRPRDVLLLVLQVWFAIWYQKRRRTESAPSPSDAVSPQS
jgi:hypothetical protein